MTVQHRRVGLLPGSLLLHHGGRLALLEEGGTPPRVFPQRHDRRRGHRPLCLGLLHLPKPLSRELARLILDLLQLHDLVLAIPYRIQGVAHQLPKLCVLGMKVAPDAAKDGQRGPLGELDLLLVPLGHSRDRLLFLFNLELVHPLLDEVLQRLPGLLDLLADAVLGALLGAYQQVRLHLLVLLALDLNPTPALQNKVLLQQSLGVRADLDGALDAPCLQVLRSRHGLPPKVVPWHLHPDHPGDDGARVDADPDVHRVVVCAVDNGNLLQHAQAKVGDARGVDLALQVNLPLSQLPVVHCIPVHIQPRHRLVCIADGLHLVNPVDVSQPVKHTIQVVQQDANVRGMLVPRELGEPNDVAEEHRGDRELVRDGLSAAPERSDSRRGEKVVQQVVHLSRLELHDHRVQELAPQRVLLDVRPVHAADVQQGEDPNVVEDLPVPVWPVELWKLVRQVVLALDVQESVVGADDAQRAHAGLEQSALRGSRVGG